jgi:CRISPR type I-E-associated protein CasB/Cse2
MSTKEETNAQPDLPSAIIKSWRAMYPYPERKHPGDPGGRAALRRAATPEAVLMEPAFHTLLSSVRESGAPLPPASDDRFYRRLALVFGVLSERRSGAGGTRPLAAVLGGSSKAEERRFKTLRFQALVAALDRGPDAYSLAALRRALKLLGDDTVNLHRFVRDLLHWDDKARIRWTFAYFGQTAPLNAPESSTPDLEEQTQ